MTAPAATVVRPQRRQRDVLFAFLVLVFTAAGLRGTLGGGHDVDDRVMAGVMFLVAAAAAAVWVRLRMRPEQLVVDAEAIRLRQAGGAEASRIVRADGAPLRFHAPSLGHEPTVRRMLLAAPSGTSIHLQFFSAAAVRDACVAHGWEVAPGVDPGAPAPH